jgi:hypothetical protein
MGMLLQEAPAPGVPECVTSEGCFRQIDITHPLGWAGPLKKKFALLGLFAYLRYAIPFLSTISVGRAGNIGSKGHACTVLVQG